jgi:tetratricopeptide (TPR) repeat protein
MLNKLNINPWKQKLIVYIALTVVTLAVFWQVNQYDFIYLDDQVYVTENSLIQSGITLDGFRWAFSTRYADLWNPLIWLSLMFDYQLHGLNAGGYHVTNLILHIISALLLFWLFNRMTGAIWRSAFVAAFFALHPLHVESVAWIAERKDVLSAFFWMLTLCLYVYYTERPVIRRYFLVLFSFVLALMSKPMVVTLPVILILLDYWPLNRLESRKIAAIPTNVMPVSINKEEKQTKFQADERKLPETRIAGIIPLWQIWEKIPFFVLSAVIVIITFYNPNQQKTSLKAFPLGSRLANAPVAFVTYLEKTFWPHDMAVFYPFSDQLPIWQVLGATLLILVISVAVIVMVRRLPYLFVGWLWYTIAILPVIGIIQVSLTAPCSMADRYHYLPSIGIAIMLAWGIPLSIKREGVRKKILLPVSITALSIMAVFTWQQCGYWKNSMELSKHALQVTKDNFVAHNFFAVALAEKGRIEEAIEHYNKSIRLAPDYAYAYYNRGDAFIMLGQYQMAIEDFNKAIHLKPDNAAAYNNRGTIYIKFGQYQIAIEDFNKAIRLKPDNASAYYNRGTIYIKLGRHQRALEDFNKAIHLKPDDAISYNCRGNAYAELGQYQMAIEDFNKTIRLKPDNAAAYNSRGAIFIKFGQYQMAIEDFNNAIRLRPDYADAYNNRGTIYTKFGQYQMAIEDFNNAIRLNPDDADTYFNRGIVYFTQGNNKSGCFDAQKACALGNCKILEAAKTKGLCH